jgi:hypothetical protein
MGTMTFRKSRGHMISIGAGTHRFVFVCITTSEGIDSRGVYVGTFNFTTAIKILKKKKKC